MFGFFLYAVECHCPLLQSPLPGGCCCFPGSMGRAGACGPPSSPSGFGPSGRWGAGSPWAWPPRILVCVYMPGSLQFTAPSPVCREAPAAIWGLSPFWGSLWSPPGSHVGIRGLEQPGEGAQGEGGHRWPFSLSGFSKGYSPGWALCLLLLSDTNSCHGWVWDGITLWGHSGSWLWEGGWGMGLPHPGGGSLIVPNPPLPSSASPSQGAAVTLALSLCGSGAQPGT